MRPAGSAENMQRRRERIIALLKEGMARVGMDRRSVRRWKAAHRREGAMGIEAKPASDQPVLSLDVSTPESAQSTRNR